jgi:multiple sugar transport system permease protein
VSERADGRGVRKPWRSLGRWLAVLAMLIAAAFFALPMLWLLVAPTKTGTALASAGPLTFGSLRQVAVNWHRLYSFQNGVILVWIRNSAEYSFSGTAVAVVVGVPAGYGLAVTRFVGRKVLLTTTLVVMLVPFNALVLPLFLEMHDFHLLGGPLSVILPFSFFPFGVYLAYIHFSSALPDDVVAAARLDGCSEWRVFRSVAAPLSLPTVALIVLFSVITSWSNYYLPDVMLQQIDKLPVSVGLQLVESGPAPEAALALLLTCAPVAVVLLFAQRALASGRWGGVH